MEPISSGYPGHVMQQSIGFQPTICLRTTKNRIILPYKGNMGIFTLHVLMVLKQIVAAQVNWDNMIKTLLQSLRPGLTTSTAISLPPSNKPPHALLTKSPPNISQPCIIVSLNSIKGVKGTFITRGRLFWGGRSASQTQTLWWNCAQRHVL